MKSGADAAGLMDAACRDLQAAVELVARGGAEELEASHGPVTQAAQRMEAAVAALRSEPLSRRACAGRALERFRRELRICAAIYEHGGAFCATWICARSGPGGQVYSPRGGGGFAQALRMRGRVSIEA
jgi:hypothetical protein